MRPRLLASVAGHPGETWPIATGGWLTTYYNAQHVWILDRRLEVIAAIPYADGFPYTDGRHLAVVNDHEIVVTDMRRRPRWRRAGTGIRTCHFDGDLLRILTDETLTTVHAGTGERIGESRHGIDHVDTAWITDPAHGRIALTAETQGRAARGRLLDFDPTGVRVTELPAPLLDFHRGQPRYLSISPDRHRLTMRDVATGAVVASCSDEELGGPDAELSPYGNAVVSESVIVTEIEDHYGEPSRHVLLCAETLQPRAVVDYPRPGQRTPKRSTESGTWLTSETGGGLCLWQLDGPLGDGAAAWPWAASVRPAPPAVLPGQLDLF
ncbi:hypothetical protein [Actinoplanes sp. L3-i22]|uniref:hypothetical protein n=1 Tax=Actinoplanes sp. L3-i22 TaxID=2836373 RepID=UPI001C846DAA|nr:hypothetical protein [Actinoplanes sp. L3-i22]